MKSLRLGPKDLPLDLYAVLSQSFLIGFLISQREASKEHAICGEPQGQRTTHLFPKNQALEKPKDFLWLANN